MMHFERHSIGLQPLETLKIALPSISEAPLALISPAAISKALLALLAPAAYRSLKSAIKAVISADFDSYIGECKDGENFFHQMISLILSPFRVTLALPQNRESSYDYDSSIPKPTLRHLHAHQIAELDLGYVVGDVLLFTISAGFHE